MSDYFFQNCVRENFYEVVSKFNLSIVAKRDIEILLVGEKYVLSILDNHENIEVYYHYLNQLNKVISYRLTNLLIEKITSTDRGNHNNPKTRKERVSIELSVLASVMINHCKDILSADTSWLDKKERLPLRINQIDEEYFFNLLNFK